MGPWSLRTSPDWFKPFGLLTLTSLACLPAWLAAGSNGCPLDRSQVRTCKKVGLAKIPSLKNYYAVSQAAPAATQAAPAATQAAPDAAGPAAAGPAAAAGEAEAPPPVSSAVPPSGKVTRDTELKLANMPDTKIAAEDITKGYK